MEVAGAKVEGVCEDGKFLKWFASHGMLDKI